MSLTNRSVLSHLGVGWIAALALLVGPSPAAAQTTLDPPEASSTGGLVVETMESGFVVAPDFRFTEVDDDFGSLVGVRAGWLTDDRLLIGGGGYWLANGSAGRKMAYGGLVVDWALARSQRFGLSFGALVGGGGTTLATEVSGGFPGRWHHRPSRDVDADATRTYLVAAREGFFIAEPQVNASLLLTRWLRLGAGVSYRLIGGAGDFDSRLRGVAGTVSVQIGAF